jgi:hypothetical protein
LKDFEEQSTSFLRSAASARLLWEFPTKACSPGLLNKDTHAKCSRVRAQIDLHLVRTPCAPAEQLFTHFANHAAKASRKCPLNRNLLTFLSNILLCTHFRTPQGLPSSGQSRGSKLGVNFEAAGSHSNHHNSSSTKTRTEQLRLQFPPLILSIQASIRRIISAAFIDLAELLLSTRKPTYTRVSVIAQTVFSINRNSSIASWSAMKDKNNLLWVNGKTATINDLNNAVQPGSGLTALSTLVAVEV